MTEDIFEAMWTSLIPEVLTETKEVPLRIRHYQLSLKIMMQFKEQSETSQQSTPPL